MRTLGLLLISFFFAAQALAQNAGSTSGPAPINRKGYEVELYGGALLPNRVAGVREIINIWGVRTALPSGKGIVEVDLFNGRGDGNVYTSGSLDYRFDFATSFSPIHALVGFHIDTWATRTASFWGGGWHLGGGMAIPIFERFFFRADFKYRFSPGQSVDADMGFFYLHPISSQ